MWNILKMDLYRLVKSKYTWIIFIVLCVGLWIGMRETCITLKTIEEDAVSGRAFYSHDSDLIHFKVSTEIYFWLNLLSKADIAAAPMWGRLFSFFISVFYVLFVHREIATGYIKNVAGQIQDRGMLVLSKLIVMALFTSFCMSCATVINMFGARNILGYTPVGGIVDMLLILGTHFILQMGYAAVTLLLVNLSRSAIFSMPLVLFLGTRMLYGEVRMKYPDNEVLMKYSLFGNIERVANGGNPSAMIWACVVGIVYIYVCTVISVKIMRRRDVRT